MKYPRILVISNNSFSKSSNNGRTLGNLFIGWPKDKIAQFCISTTVPDFGLCDNYYLLTDSSVLEGFKHFQKGKRCNIEENIGIEGNTVIGGKKAFKTPWKAILRHFVWAGKRWNSKEFQKWIDYFAPEIIVVMNSDATFILDIAYDVSIERKIPLVMYNTEGFYFFKENYFRPSKLFNDALFSLYQSIYRSHFRKLMKRVVLSVHLNSMLEDDYKNEFGGKHMVLYTGSSLKFDSSNLHTESPTFTYLGNFGYDRPTALIEIAEVLQSIDPNYKLDVYGNISMPVIKERFDACGGICYKGMIPYDEVVKVMYSSTILFHAEVQSEKFEESLRHGFSTKIADSISCGHPFLMYSSPNIAGAKYIIETGAAWHAKDKHELRTIILSILKDDNKRNRVLQTAKTFAIRNHNVENNSKLFKEALVNLQS